MPIIQIEKLRTFLGNQWVINDLDLSVERGEIIGIAGGSGSGKTTLLRNILMLLKPASGSIKVFDTDILRCSPRQAQQVRQRWGVMFQHSALFSSLTVLENVMYPLDNANRLDKDLKEEISLLKLALVGLPLDAANKLPAELSGGMQKRVALARAIVMDPELIFLDEPTTGLDPQSADVLDALIKKIAKTLGLTVVMITHDLDTLWRVTDRVAFLGEGRVLAIGSMESIEQNPHPTIRNYFSGPRGYRRKVE